MVAAFDAAAISFYRPAVERHPTEAAGGETNNPAWSEPRGLVEG